MSIHVSRQPAGWGFRRHLPPIRDVGAARISPPRDKRVELTFGSGGEQRGTAWYVHIHPQAFSDLARAMVDADTVKAEEAFRAALHK